jgi:SAM-dependent methyltransferase
MREMSSGRDDIERLKSVYAGKGEGRAQLWSHDNWGPMIPEIQFGEGQYRDLIIEALREHGLGTADMAALRVVELGCGWGRNLHLFVELGVPASSIAGVDLIEHFIAFGRSQNPALDIAAGDATQTGLGDGSFDVVLLHTVLSSILDPDIQARLLGEARRLVKASGIVLVYDIDDHYPVGRTEVSGREVAFIQPLPRRALRAMVESCGLRVRHWKRCGLMPRPRKLVLRGLSQKGSGFSARRAVAALLSLMPRASSHYFVVLAPAPEGERQ